MDTNLLQLVQAMRQSNAHEWLNPTLVAAIAGVLMALAAFIQARTAAVKMEKTAVEVDKIHVAVNSRASAMELELKKLREDLLRVSGEKITLEEATRSRTLADAVKGAAAAAAAPPASSTTPVNVEIVAPASEGGGALSDPQLRTWIETLQREQAARAKK